MGIVRRVLFAFFVVCVSLSALAQSADQEVVSVVDSPDPVIPGNTLTYTITLRNNGQVNVKVDKRITAQGTWTAGAAGGANTFALYTSTSVARPSIADFVIDTHPLFGALNADTQLTGVLGTQPTLTPSGGTQTVDLWFRLDMPTSVTAQTAQEITMRFTGTAQ